MSCHGAPRSARADLPWNRPGSASLTERFLPLLPLNVGGKREAVSSQGPAASTCGFEGSGTHLGAIAITAGIARTQRTGFNARSSRDNWSTDPGASVPSW